MFNTETIFYQSILKASTISTITGPDLEGKPIQNNTKSLFCTFWHCHPDLPI